MVPYFWPAGAPSRNVIFSLLILCVVPKLHDLESSNWDHFWSANSQFQQAMTFKYLKQQLLDCRGCQKGVSQGYFQTLLKKVFSFITKKKHIGYINFGSSD